MRFIDPNSGNNSTHEFIMPHDLNLMQEIQIRISMVVHWKILHAAGIHTQEFPCEY